MEATVYQIEVENKDILFFEDLIKRMSMKVINKEEKDPTEMTKEEFFSMIDKARKSPKYEMNFDELIEKTLSYGE